MSVSHCQSIHSPQGDNILPKTSNRFESSVKLLKKKKKKTWVKYNKLSNFESPAQRFPKLIPQNDNYGGSSEFKPMKHCKTSISKFVDNVETPATHKHSKNHNKEVLGDRRLSQNYDVFESAGSRNSLDTLTHLVNVCKSKKRGKKLPSGYLNSAVYSNLK